MLKRCLMLPYRGVAWLFRQFEKGALEMGRIEAMQWGIHIPDEENNR